ELNEVAGLLLEIGFPADALRVYNEVLGLTDAIREAQPYLGNVDYVLQQARSGADRALRGLNGETLAATLQSLIRPEAGDAGGGGKSGGPDLVLTVDPRELDKASVTSLLATALGLAAKDPALLGRVRSDVDATVKARPDDLGAQTAAALLEAAAG